MKKVSKTTAKKTSTKKSAKTNKTTKKTSERVLSAAAQLKKTTKKMVDDVFLKLVGMKVLARAQQVTESIQKERKPRKKARR